MPPRRHVDPWNSELLDGASLRLAEQAAQAAALPLERWLERAIRRACGPGQTTVLPPGSLPPKSAEPVPTDDGLRSRWWRPLVLLLPPLLLLAGFFLLALPPASTGPEVALPRAPQAEVALPLPGGPTDAAPTDPKQLALWLVPRAEQGDALAEYRLGTLYALGKGVDKDYTRAAPLLHAAAENGVAEAQYDYAVLCEHGFGVAKDPVEALAWYRKAAAQGNGDASLSLGYAYAKGIGVGRDMGSAAQWFEHAAQLGVIDAQYNLAFLYEHGEGVETSLTNAFSWYSIAAARGDAGAKTAANRIAHELSATDLVAATTHMLELQKSVKPSP